MMSMHVRAKGAATETASLSVSRGGEYPESRDGRSFAPMRRCCKRISVRGALAADRRALS
jgi:hypothetical protein